MIRKFYEFCEAAFEAASKKDYNNTVYYLYQAHGVAEEICKTARQRLELGRAQEISDHFVGIHQNCLFIFSDRKQGRHRSGYLRSGNILETHEPERLQKSSLRRIQREVPYAEERYLPFAWPNFRYLTSN